MDKWEQYKTDKWSQYQLGAPIPEQSFVEGKQVETTPLTFMEETAYNIPTSAYRTFVEPILNLPEMPGAVKNMTLGLVEKAIPGTSPEHAKYADAVWEYMKDRYGGIDNILYTIKTDPVGIGMEALSIPMGAGLALRGAGAITKIPSMVKAGTALTQFASDYEPISIAARGTSWLGKKGFEKAGIPLLQATSGAPARAIGLATEGVKEYVRGLRGRISPEEIIEKARSAYGAVKDARQEEYLLKMHEIFPITTKIDFAPVRVRLKKLMETYKIKEVDLPDKMVPTGILDDVGEMIMRPEKQGKHFVLDRVPTDDRGKSTIKEVMAKVDDWGRYPEDFTVAGLDTLKRYLDDLYAPTNEARQFVQSMRDVVNKQIIHYVPEYSELTSGYKKMSDLLRDVEQALLGKGGRGSKDTALRKMIGALGDDQSLRFDLIKKLDEYGGKDLVHALAGVSMSGVLPKTWLGRSMGAAEVFGAIFGERPEMLAGLMIASPRIVGELMVALGKSARAYQKVGKVGPPSRMGIMWLGGRVPETQVGLVP